MKRLSLTQPTVLLMVGIPGAGKSYFARRFAEEFDLPCVSGDRLRSAMVNEPQYTPAEQEIVHRVADYLIDELLRGGKSFVVDGLMGNVRTQRLNLERRARERGFGVLVVWTQVDQTTARSRSLKRNSKKVDDQYNVPLPETAFTSMLKQLTPPTTESYVVISGKHTFPAQKEAVLRKLPRETAKNPSEKSASPRSIEVKPQTEEPKEQPPTKMITHTPSRRMDGPYQRFNSMDNVQHRPPEQRHNISASDS